MPASRECRKRRRTLATCSRCGLHLDMFKMWFIATCYVQDGEFKMVIAPARKQKSSKDSRSWPPSDEHDSLHESGDIIENNITGFQSSPSRTKNNIKTVGLHPLLEIERTPSFPLTVISITQAVIWLFAVFAVLEVYACKAQI